MAAWYGDLFTAIRTAVATAWPEVIPNGIYHELEMSTVVFGQKCEADDLPLAVFGTSLRPAQYAADSGTEEGELRIYYITTDATSIDTLVGKLETLRNQLWDTALTTGQIIGWPAIDLSLDLPPNAYFLAAQRPNLSGCVRATVVVGEIAGG